VVSATGSSVWVEDEALINVVTAVSGSGPAYFFLLTEAMRDAGVALGLPEVEASRLALHTAWGAGAMAMDQDVDVAELRMRVTSPGGTTQAAMDTFERGDFKQLVFRAIESAAQRSEELAAAGAGK
jgi:pyrroline-5-carboxylate reductase